jgi:Fic family protein
MTRTSRATAQREIADLVVKGLLVRRLGGGRSTSYEIVW